ncbi:Putative prophage phiRv2 integrase [Corynebacterium kalinowskii]|uniref:Prophage phiRv2 integrase n=1 Tax=Corynebacterium kalinowskii TaxID=2675216 RepID=A0A6B8W413_9CORY|nr:tyrosine-type recombinase/integrase [Corynebacterium kalinowskii]QGU02168.1 Putative prophage phiRv2 integrase [Corynebacterium kalinowskii]
MAKKNEVSSFGNIRKLPSGKFQARYVGPDGLRHKAPETFYLIGDAHQWLEDEEYLIRKGHWTPPAERIAAEQEKKDDEAFTVRVLMARWLDEKEREGLAVSTMAKYRDRVDRRITGDGVPGSFADLPVKEVTVSKTRMWWDQITDQWPDSGEMNRKAYQHLRSAFADLVEDELIPANPISVKAGKRKVKPTYEKDLLDVNELVALYGQASDRYKLMTALVFFHGLRIGEAIALKRKHILVTRDEKGEVTSISVKVEDNYQRIDGKMVSMGKTKTPAGMRTVPVFKAFYADIMKHLETFTGPDDDDLVTTTRSGSPVMDTSYRSTVKAMKDKAEIKKRVHPHSGRRFVTTALLEQGVEPSVVGKIIGDRDLTTVLEVYAQVRPGRTQEVMNKLGETITL